MQRLSLSADGSVAAVVMWTVPNAAPAGGHPGVPLPTVVDGISINWRFESSLHSDGGMGMPVSFLSHRLLPTTAATAAAGDGSGPGGAVLARVAVRILRLGVLAQSVSPPTSLQRRLRQRRVDDDKGPDCRCFGLAAAGHTARGSWQRRERRTGEAEGSAEGMPASTKAEKSMTAGPSIRSVGGAFVGRSVRSSVCGKGACQRRRRVHPSSR
jgi:hypothetical protein